MTAFGVYHLYGDRHSVTTITCQAVTVRCQVNLDGILGCLHFGARNDFSVLVADGFQFARFVRNRPGVHFVRVYRLFGYYFTVQ